MYVEIGGLIKKGLGHNIIDKFSKKKNVITVGKLRRHPIHFQIGYLKVPKIGHYLTLKK